MVIKYMDKVIYRDGKGRFAISLIKRFLKLCLAGSGMTVVILSAYFIGQYHNPIVVYGEKKVVVEVPIQAPVLERIAQCESGNSHYGKSGQVFMLANTNGTVDVGRYMINTVWFETANDMGLDLTDEKDNETFARYLYENFGTEPWKYSRECWSK